MAGRTTGEAKIWLALGLFVTGLATAAPSATAAAVDKTLATQVAEPISNDEVKTAAEIGAQSVDVVPVAQRISPIGKTLADLRGQMPDYLGSNANGEMFWNNYDVLKSTATGPISVANYDEDELGEIYSSGEGFVDQSGNLFYFDAFSCFVLKKLSLGGSAPVNLSAPHQDEECAFDSPTDGLVSGKQLLPTSNLAFDASGNIYLTEQTYYDRSTKIRKITTSTGELSTIAGTGNRGSTGADGSVATAANITVYGDIDVDGLGNVYFIQVTAGDNTKIRRIKPDGTIETFRTAGAGLEFSQVLAGPDGSVYFTEWGVGSAYKITKVKPDNSVVYIGDGTEGSSGDGASAALAKIGAPVLVDVLSDNSLVFSYYNLTSDLPTDPFENQWNIIRRVTSAGVISTLTGLGDVVVNAPPIKFGIAG